jgi:hypothetical protein
MQHFGPEDVNYADDQTLSLAFADGARPAG